MSLPAEAACKDTIRCQLPMRRARDRARGFSRAVAGWDRLVSTVADDLELLDAWRAGDRAAGNQLFDRHFESIRRFFANKAGRDTEDLVQRTFLGCIEGSTRFEGRSSFRTFLFGVANNILREHLRRKRRDERIDPATHSVADLGAGPSSIVAKKVEHRLLLEALRSIPVQFQVALELYFWEDLTGTELGEILGLPENTARSRVRRGKELLEKALRGLEARPEDIESTAGNLDRWAADVRDRVLPPPL